MIETSNPRNVAQKKLSKVTTAVKNQGREEIKQKIVEIAEVTEDSQVRVNLLDNSLKTVEKYPYTIPVLQSLEYIHQVFGSLRPGLIGIVTYQGEDVIHNGTFQVIAENKMDLILKKQATNTIETGPSKILSGGPVPGAAGSTDKGTYEQRRVIKVDQESKSGIELAPDGSRLIGSPSSFVLADKQGITFSGNSISLGTLSENIRQGGMFINMNDFVKMIPSTLATPIPPEIPVPPIGMVTSILYDLPFFIAMLGSAI